LDLYEAQVAASLASDSAKTTVIPPTLGASTADAKHMFHVDGMIWHFYKIQDPIKHAEALAKSIAILRVIGTSPQGRAHQAAFFQSKVLYTLVSSNIHSHLVKFSSSSAIHPEWGCNTGTVIHRVTKFPVFTDPQKFEAFCHLRFSA
jgi:hypothetical protein